MNHIVPVTFTLMLATLSAYSLSPNTGSDPPAQESATHRTIRSMTLIVIPEINVDQYDLTETCEYLSTASKGLDPEGRGLNIVFDNKGFSKTPKVTLHLKNISIIKLLEKLVINYSVEYSIDGDTITVKKANKAIDATP